MVRIRKGNKIASNNKKKNFNSKKKEKKQTNSKKERKAHLEIKAANLSVMLVFSVFIIKLSASFLTNSLSFYAEFTDSIIDLIAVSITYFGLRQGQKEPDIRHMFGHYKINSFAALVQGVLICIIYFLILFEAVKRIFTPQITLINSVPAALSLTISMVLVLFISQKIKNIGKKTKNPLIIATGVNFRGDLFRNITMILGLILINFGIYFVDIVLAIIFSLISIKEGFGVIRESFFELIDTNPIKEGKITRLKAKIKDIPNIKELNSLKLKKIGNSLDIQIALNYNLGSTVYTAQETSRLIRKKVKNFFSNFDCNVVIDYTPQSSLNEKQMGDSKEHREINVNYIRDLLRKNQYARNIHNIKIDRYQDEVLIQFHIDMEASLTLKKAHEIITNLEKKLEQKMIHRFQIHQKIEIVSHVEPIASEDRTHQHSIEKTVPENLEEIEKLLMDNIHEIKEIKNLKQLRSEEDPYFSMKFLIPGNLTISECHRITELAESLLYKRYPGLKDCVIHTEPLD